MKHTAAVLAVLLAAAPAVHAQAPSTSEAAFLAGGAQDVATAKSLTDAALAGKWAGHLDLTSAPTFGAWQSLKSADQAVGISKRLYHVDAVGQPLLNVGVFAGAAKALLSKPGAGPRVLGGLTFAVPGSTLDWALGTKWGDAWLPKLKTGVLAAYDLTRPKTLKAVPDFVGIGASYPAFGGN